MSKSVRYPVIMQNAAEELDKLRAEIKQLREENKQLRQHPNGCDLIEALADLKRANDEILRLENLCRSYADIALNNNELWKFVEQVADGELTYTARAFAQSLVNHKRQNDMLTKTLPGECQSRNGMICRRFYLGESRCTAHGGKALCIASPPPNPQETEG